AATLLRAPHGAPGSSATGSGHRCAARYLRAARESAARIRSSPHRWPRGRASSCPEISKLCAERLQRAEVMCLDAAFRATHGGSGLRYIEALERPKHEHLLLPAGESLECPLQGAHRFGDLQLARRLRISAGRLGDRVLLLIIVIATPEGKPGDDATANGTAP